MPRRPAAVVVLAAFGPTGDDLALRPLPDDVLTLLVDVGAPPRLVAHLRAVHDVACTIVDRLGAAWPRAPFDADAVRIGAALHDVGKALHPEELSAPGGAHEAAGYELLVGRGVPERHARFARTHGAWREPDATLEDQLVTLADKVWKGRRDQELEDRIVARLSAAGTGRAVVGGWLARSHRELQVMDQIEADSAYYPAKYRGG